MAAQVDFGLGSSKESNRRREDLAVVSCGQRSAGESELAKLYEKHQALWPNGYDASRGTCGAPHPILAGSEQQHPMEGHGQAIPEISALRAAAPQSPHEDRPVLEEGRKEALFAKALVKDILMSSSQDSLVISIEESADLK
ncbi:hypothetical protein KIN20_025074 [Parelaphostrongylus tenuis]|uniref:Uncharacterized protein n=1 Tax=Parelaphostrongylus tenuis TaxID=148309 RepID=A0AAD5QXQ2_PARTN|nr:hypothetical protein KIN20_025074 [Parelaphostrongylus tenuis]